MCIYWAGLSSVPAGASAVSLDSAWASAGAAAASFEGSASEEVQRVCEPR